MKTPGVNPVISDIYAVDIKDSTTAGKSIVTVFAKYTTSGGTSVGSAAYEIDKVQGTTYQDKLDNINEKITASNIVAESKQFTGINTSAPALLDDLKSSPKLTTGGLKGVTIDEKITEYATSAAPGGTRGYMIGGIIKTTAGKWYNMYYGVSHTNGLAGTQEQIYGYLASGNNVTAITEGRWGELTGVADYFELEEEYQEWRQAQQKAAPQVKAAKTAVALKEASFSK